MALSNYIQICDAIAKLMNPLVEIVIHEIASDKIVYINGCLSKRGVGDTSLLSQDSLDEVRQIVYLKINFDGKLVKSISVVLEGKWLLCINCDISVFNKMAGLSAIILQGADVTQPKPLFANDWQEKMHVAVHSYLQDHNLSFEHLTTANKKAVVRHLFELKAFNEKNAADYVAKVLGLGRATIFKYLKECKDQ